MSTNTIDVRRFGIVLAATAVALGTWNVRYTYLAAHDGAHTVQYRVNAGGDAVPGSPNWSQDLAGAPSTHVNAVATGNTTHDTWLSIDVSHPSLPAGTPASLFQSERWDLPAAPAMQWSFPVTPGTYHVRLYFAEIYFTGVGERVFDVTIENDVVLDDYDIVADAGAFKGVMKSFTVTSDASLDILFGHVVENPKISAIEILAAADSPGEVGIAPDSVAFGPVLVGQGGTRTVQVTNLGAAGAPNIDIYATTVTGTDASHFWDSFNDGTAVTLGPGQSMSITVGFAPITTGPKTAALEISHFGNNSPAIVPLTGAGTAVAAGTWQSRASSGLSRQEVAYVHLGGKLYLAGGSAAHEVYDPATNAWAALMPLPVNVDHIQAVTLGGRIYYIGGLLAWPAPASSAVTIYDPATDSFTQGAAMPRPRGAGGVAVHNGKIYYAGGLANGTAVNWFDVYDPLSNTWTALPNMPVARDHFHAAVVGDKLYVTGGRDTSIEATISSTIAFDFSAGNWQAGLAPIPTPRGGFGAAVLGSEILVIGGEGGGLTYGTVEAYDTTTNTWRTLASMPTPRHGIQAAECSGGIYVAAGGATEGGATPTNVHEVFFLGSESTCGSAPPPPPPPPPTSGVLYRVNAGGESVPGTPNWSADPVAAPSPYTNAAATGNTTGETWLPIDMTHPSLPAGTPASLFQTERWDLPDAPAMHWSFPVTPGTYQVRLYFAEFYVSSAGERVFNVFIEGNPVLTNYDIVADVGALKGVMKSFTVTTDTSLDIAFGHGIENPKVSAIEILGGATSTGDLGVAPASVSFGDVLVSQSTSRSLQLTNLGGSGAPSIDISSTVITGTHASQFADNFNDAATVTLAPGQSTSITITFAPSTTGVKTAALQVAHSGNGSPISIPLSGTSVTSAPPPPPPSSAALYRVNAGGGTVSGTPNWSADSEAAPSPYVNAAATGNTTYETSMPVDMSHASLPAGTPAGLFQSERWDLPGAPEMQWSFPVAPGTYEVRLYFAEIFFGSAGERVFDVVIEGSPVLSAYDIVADAGAFNGVMKSFTVTADASLDVVLGHVVENPKISAIEVLDATPSPGQLGASPTSVAFGTVLLGQSTTRTLQLTNLGGSGAPDIDVEATTITGVHASEFGHNFNDAGTVTLAPGQSMALTVSFLPTSAGSKTADLQIAHSGNNSPLVIPLGATATTTGTIGFGKSTLSGMPPFSLVSPTSLQFGPDGRLYIGQQDGLIHIYTVARNAANSYVVASSETIDSISSVPNHDDNGIVNPDVTTRLITGILVVGTAANPVVYVAHSDPRIGGGPSGDDLNLDTNSSMISRLTWNGSSWSKLDLVRGLPRSEENHAANGMQLDPVKNILYVTMGGNTNKGAPSHNFAYLPEFALSAAILTIDLAAIGDTTYDLPTLDDETRPGNPDPGDPFGGNNGKNQAILVPGGPVQVYAPGFRNPYDLVLTQSGRLYTVDNGGNAGWGDVPVGAGPAGTCTNQPNEPGTTSPDSLHLITGPGYYGGHPNPTRGNIANTFNASNPQSPVTVANPVECEYREAGAASGALATFPESTNGLTEYTSANFGGALQGNLLAVSWDNVLYRIQLDATGTTATHVSPLFSTIGALPLDVDTLGPEAPFPGTIWISDYWTGQIFVFEPNDYELLAPSCTGAYDWSVDEDLDGYSNADEIDNGTNPCSAGDVPPDWDGDFISDLNDPDDDNDGIPDVSDPFALDPLNGTGTRLPVFYGWENDGSTPGGILNLGFTGLMTNGVSNYAALYDRTRMTAGGAAGVLTVDRVSEGDAFGALNNQEYGLQFGLWANPVDTDVFFVHTRILAPFSGLTPHDGQSMGLFVGTGDQDNYAKIVVSGSFGGGIAFLQEVGGAAGPEVFASVALPGPTSIDLYLRVDPDTSSVQPFYSVTSGGVTGPQIAVTLPQQVPSSWFANPLSGLAVGIISTSRGPGPEFPATWDFIRAVPATTAPLLAVSPSTAGFGGVMIGDTRSLTLQLTNPGGAASADLVVNSTTITGIGAGQFSDNFNDAAAVSLAPGEATTVTVTFAPGSTGSTSATLAIGHSGANAPVLVPLTGTGVTSAPTLGVSPTSLSFGGVTIGQSTALAVTLTNLGTSDIAVESTTVTGTHAAEFSDDFSGPLTLGASETVALMVTFTPSSSGSRNAILQIAHSGGNTPVAVSLEGSGVGAAAPVLGVSPANLSFGNVTVGQKASLPIELTNLGTTNLVVAAVSVSGAQADQFTVAPESGSIVMLAPGTSTTMHVTFAPTSNGSKSGTLEITHSGANSPVLVPLGGTGSNRRR